MCRLFGYVSREQITLEELAPGMVAGHADISHVHADGWGISWYDEHDQLRLLTDTTAAFQSQVFIKSLQDMKTKACIGHLRHASPGLSICIPNSHPFVYGSYAFAHNGLIAPQHALEKLITSEYLHVLQGTTDSERYFLALLSTIDQEGTLMAGIQRLQETLRCDFQATSTICLFLTPDTLYVVCSYNPSLTRVQEDPDYFSLQYCLMKDAIVIRSTGFGQEGGDWRTLANGQILLIKRDTLKVTILDFCHDAEFLQQTQLALLHPQGQ